MDFIDLIIRREGGEKETNDPDDSGGRTKWGISERAHPELWVDGPPTYAQARACYAQKYLLPFAGITDPLLVEQLADWSVTSGVGTVIRVLQQLVGTTADGVLGPITLGKVNSPKDATFFGHPIPGTVALNLALRDARIIFYATLAKRRPKDLKYILGWLARTQSFR
jgi:lysozyme family protein